jgi:hypothetical protein
MYNANVVTPKVDPYVVPRIKTPRVCPVTGTGEPGTGIAICAKAAIAKTPLTTKTAFERAVVRGIRDERSEVADSDIVFPSTDLSCGGAYFKGE